MAAWNQADICPPRQPSPPSLSEADKPGRGGSFLFGLFVLTASVVIAFGLNESFRALMSWERITTFLARCLA
jgi:hypothetical protein